MSCFCSRSHTCFDCRRAKEKANEARAVYEDAQTQLLEREKNLARQDANREAAEAVFAVGKFGVGVVKEFPVASGLVALLGIGLGMKMSQSDKPARKTTRK